MPHTPQIHGHPNALCPQLDASQLRCLTRLGCLDVSNNQLQAVPPELGLVETLKSLKLEVVYPPSPLPCWPWPTHTRC